MAQKITLLVVDPYAGGFPGGDVVKEIVYRTEGQFIIETFNDDYIKVIDDTKNGYRLIDMNFKELILEEV